MDKIENMRRAEILKQENPMQFVSDVKDILEEYLKGENQSQKQPEGLEERIKNAKPHSVIPVTEEELKELNKPEKQEEWSVRLGTILNDNCIDIFDEDGAELKEDLEKFISQLLSERTFTNRELRLILYIVSGTGTSEKSDKLWNKLSDDYLDEYAQDSVELQNGANELVEKLSKLLAKEEE